VKVNKYSLRVSVDLYHKPPFSGKDTFYFDRKLRDRLSEWESIMPSYENRVYIISFVCLSKIINVWTTLFNPNNIINKLNCNVANNYTPSLIITLSFKLQQIRMAFHLNKYLFRNNLIVVRWPGRKYGGSIQTDID